jgi:hypothetical protein
MEKNDEFRTLFLKMLDSSIVLRRRTPLSSPELYF